MPDTTRIHSRGKSNKKLHQQGKVTVKSRQRPSNMKTHQQGKVTIQKRKKQINKRGY